MIRADPGRRRTRRRPAIPSVAPVARSRLGTAACRARRARRRAAPPIVLLHGSPGGRFDFDGLTRRARPRSLRDRAGPARLRRLRLGDVPDYSVHAHAAYVEALLDARCASRGAHVVGFSMGGGVAIALARRQPDRVASLTLLSGLGVQEQELFGRYWVNHAVHGAQLAALWLLTEATPHFGLFDRMFMGVEYAPELLRHRPAAAPAGAARLRRAGADLPRPARLPRPVRRGARAPSPAAAERARDERGRSLRHVHAAAARSPPPWSRSWPPSIVASGRPVPARRRRCASRPSGLYAGPVGTRAHGAAPRYRSWRGCRSPVDRCGDGVAAPSQTTAAEVKISAA